MSHVDGYLFKEKWSAYQLCTSDQVLNPLVSAVQPQTKGSTNTRETV